jgi:hypothetical protein
MKNTQVNFTFQQRKIEKYRPACVRACAAAVLHEIVDGRQISSLNEQRKQKAGNDPWGANSFRGNSGSFKAMVAAFVLLFVVACSSVKASKLTYYADAEGAVMPMAFHEGSAVLGCRRAPLRPSHT